MPKHLSQDKLGSSSTTGSLAIFARCIIESNFLNEIFLTFLYHPNNQDFYFLNNFQTTVYQSP